MRFLKHFKLLKKLFAILALCGILLQAFSGVVIVAEYYANKQYIAKNLCENRDRPKMHCDGKCCLKRKLASQGKEQAPNSRNQKSEETINLFYSDITTPQIPLLLSSESNKYYSYNELGTTSYHAPVFHPPAA